MSDHHTAATELLARRGARADMAAYREYMAPSGHLDFAHEPARHHRVMMDALQRLADPDNPLKRLVIAAPRGSAKSTYSSVQYPTWYLARNPGHNILCASNTSTVAEAFNRRRRNACLTPEWQQISQTSLRDDEQSLSRFATQAGGAIAAFGVGSTIVGFRADTLLIDDPVSSFEEAQSTTQLEKQWEWLQSDAIPTLTPGGSILVVSTRWSSIDMIGLITELKEQDIEPDWEILRFPMLCDDPENDPLGRPFAAPLWPEHYTDAQIEQGQRDPQRWSGMFQQRPLDSKGQWLPKEHIHLTDNEPEHATTIIALDMALTVGRGDFSVILTAKFDHNRKLTVIDVWRDRVDPAELAKQLFARCDQFQASTILIDDDPAAKVFRSSMLEQARTMGRPLPIQMMRLAGKDKETRAAAIRGYFLSDQVKLLNRPWVTDLLHEADQFPNSKHDDIIDCLSLLGRHIAKLTPASPPLGTVKPEPLNDSIILQDGKYVLNMSLDELHAEREPTEADRIRDLYRV